MSDEFFKIRKVKDIKSIFVHFFPFFYRKKEYLKIFSFCAYRIPKNHKKTIFTKHIKLNEDYYETKFLLKKGLCFFKFRNYRYLLNAYTGKIKINNLGGYGPQNLFILSFKNKNTEITMPSIYNIIYLTKNWGKTSKTHKINDYLVCYFRQAKNNSAAITVRKPNVTDRFSKRWLLFWAWLLSLVTPKSKKVFFFEKEANKYEESAAYLYEKLIDTGYTNCYFVLNKNSKHTEFIKPKYQKNIIWTHTFKHYLNFFRGKNFIGTETVPHVIELRCANEFVTRKLTGKKYRSVFLQHGPTYNVSIDARGRGYFIKGNEMPDGSKIVVSSQKEADHFIELGGWSQEDLYISGLPFYDRTIKKATADKITIMLTWRNWEYNILAHNYKKSNYYKMIRKILDNIPKKYQDKILLLPHPLILDKLKNTDLNYLIPDILSYDKILEDTALLITDYSSISWSAFYRGANVIFCFEELEECMQKYGGKLMLNESNIFGDISYKFSDLQKLVENNYLKPQTTLHKKRYKEVVAFDDNKNTDRLIEMLKKDGFI